MPTPTTLNRRELLSAVAGAAALSALPTATASASAANDRYAVQQGGTCASVVPLSGDRPVEELYGLRIPDRFEGDNGASDPGTGPYYGSVGTRDLQRVDTTITFLYDGPNGLSLVVVHGSFTSGGSVSWTVAGVPAGATWAVKDDRYLDPETGDPAATNYDRWDVDGSTHRIDWTWGQAGTDGGALRGIGDGFSLLIDPAFNESAALYGEYYEGTLTDWQFLSFPDGRESPRRIPLELDAELVVRTGACDDGKDGDGDDEGGEEDGKDEDRDEEDENGSGDRGRGRGKGRRGNGGGNRGRGDEGRGKGNRGRGRSDDNRGRGNDRDDRGRGNDKGDRGKGGRGRGRGNSRGRGGRGG
ncbi:hypothetical protein [Halostella salina]|uniref:hypothetical protein n=1 Tax=Halostella salina TaxID=1547897 RepID=UPI000EF8289C|nr:hypothetical protein [Halostella salina]